MRDGVQDRNPLSLVLKPEALWKRILQVKISGKYQSEEHGLRSLTGLSFNPGAALNQLCAAGEIACFSKPEFPPLKMA